MKNLLPTLLLVVGLPLLGRGETWRPLGPPGGDVRSLATDPSHPETLFLGTADGLLYRSQDSGAVWRRVQPGFPLRGMSLDEIVVDSRGRLFVGYWEVAGKGGGIARSDDGGVTFTVLSGIAGESVRALAIASRNPDTVVAGTLSGVFRSKDGGGSWERVETPSFLVNVESIALDPGDAGRIYAGTWHLPWKTADGGKRWIPIHQGIIDDSDIFTLTVDLERPSTLYATACTGIYRSQDFGLSWSRMRGIPASSRRTRSFAQDPEHPERLYAGTTEGLWTSLDSGASWSLATARSLVVNSVVILPGSRIFLGCEGAGVLKSFDGGLSWASSNDGFSERFVSAVLFDPAGGRALAGIEGDRSHGGVLSLTREGWRRIGVGLEGREVLSLALWAGEVWAGTDDGVYHLREASGAWRREPAIVGGQELHARIPTLCTLSRGGLAVASAHGLLVRLRPETPWIVRTPGISPAILALAASPGGVLLAGTSLGIHRSLDDGISWERLSTTPDPHLHSLAFLPGNDSVVFATTPSGLYRSQDQGASWFRQGGGLPISDITGLALHPDGKTVYASDFTFGGLFRSRDRGDTWSSLPTDGLVSDKIWAVAIDPASPESPIVAGRTGGLSVLAPAREAVPPSSRAAGSPQRDPMD